MTKLKALLLRTRRTLRALADADVAHSAEITIASERHGSEYGGWVVCPLTISSNSVVYSFGVGEDASFDVSLIAKYGVSVCAFDPTPKSVQWVAAQDLPSAFRYYPLGISQRDGTAIFNGPRNPRHASYTMLAGEGDNSHSVEVQVRRLATIMADLNHSQIDILKLDIEGAEYDVIPDIISSNLDVKQILIEFHHAFDNVSIRQTNGIVDLLRRSGYRLFYVSPRGEEYSFIRSDIIISS